MRITWHRYLNKKTYSGFIGYYADGAERYLNGG